MDIQDTYLALLRTACLGTEPVTLPVLGEAEWQELFRFCRVHGTGPLIYNELLKSPALPPQWALQLKQACMQNMLLQGQWEQVIAKVWKALEGEKAKDEEAIHAVLMKGFAYARLYPLSYLRAWGDLDVWVGPEQYHRACGILRDAFPEAKHHDEEWEELKHYCFVFPNGMAIELHRVSMDFLSRKEQDYWCRLEKEASPLTYVAPQLANEQLTCSEDDKKPNVASEKLVINGVEIPLFEPKFDVLFCFMHSWEHFCGSGIPLKQVADMALVVQSTKCKVQNAKLEAYLERHLKALHMLEVWKSYGYLVCKVMGLGFELWPLGVDEQYGERLYEQVMAEGQCRKKDYGEAGDRYEAREKARQMNILARKWLTLRGRLEKALFMRRFAPRYARHVFWQEVKKGVRRTIRREEMINY